MSNLRPGQLVMLKDPQTNCGCWAVSIIFLTIQSPKVYSLFKLSEDINWSRNIQPMIKRRPRFYEKLSISRILLSFVQLRPVDLLRNSHCWLGKMPEQSSPNRNPQSLQSQDILVAGERNRSVARVDHWPWNGHRPKPTSLWSNTHSSLWRITCEMWRHISKLCSSSIEERY